MSLITIASTVPFIPNTPHDKHPYDLGKNLRFRLQHGKQPHPPFLDKNFVDYTNKSRI